MVFHRTTAIVLVLSIPFPSLGSARFPSAGLVAPAATGLLARQAFSARGLWGITPLATSISAGLKRQGGKLLRGLVRIDDALSRWSGPMPFGLSANLSESPPEPPEIYLYNLFTQGRYDEVIDLTQRLWDQKAIQTSRQLAQIVSIWGEAAVRKEIPPEKQRAFLENLAAWLEARRQQEGPEAALALAAVYCHLTLTAVREQKLSDVLEFHRKTLDEMNREGVRDITTTPPGLPIHLEALVESAAGEAHAHVWDIRSSMESLHASWSHYQRAVECFKKSSWPDDNEWAISLMSMAWNAVDLSVFEPEKSQTWLNKASAAVELAAGKGIAEPVLQTIRGAIASHRGDLIGGRRLLLQSFKTMPGKEKLRASEWTVAGIARTYALEENWPQAAAWFGKIRRPSPRVLYELGRVHFEWARRRGGERSPKGYAPAYAAWRDFFDSEAFALVPPAAFPGFFEDFITACARAGRIGEAGPALSRLLADEAVAPARIAGVLGQAGNSEGVRELLGAMPETDRRKEVLDRFDAAKQAKEVDRLQARWEGILKGSQKGAKKKPAEEIDQLFRSGQWTDLDPGDRLRRLTQWARLWWTDASQRLSRSPQALRRLVQELDMTLIVQSDGQGAKTLSPLDSFSVARLSGVLEDWAVSGRDGFIRISPLLDSVPSLRKEVHAVWIAVRDWDVNVRWHPALMDLAERWAQIAGASSAETGASRNPAFEPFWRNLMLLQRQMPRSARRSKFLKPLLNAMVAPARALRNRLRSEDRRRALADLEATFRGIASRVEALLATPAGSLIGASAGAEGVALREIFETTRRAAPPAISRELTGLSGQIDAGLATLAARSGSAQREREAEELARYVRLLERLPRALKLAELDFDQKEGLLTVQTHPYVALAVRGRRFVLTEAGLPPKTFRLLEVVDGRQLVFWGDKPKEGPAQKVFETPGSIEAIEPAYGGRLRVYLPAAAYDAVAGWLRGPRVESSALEFAVARSLHGRPRAITGRETASSGPLSKSKENPVTVIVRLSNALAARLPIEDKSPARKLTLSAGGTYRGLAMMLGLFPPTVRFFEDGKPVEDNDRTPSQGAVVDLFDENDPDLLPGAQTPAALSRSS